MSETARRAPAIVWGDGEWREVDVLEEEKRGPIHWRRVRFERVLARRPDRNGAERRVRRTVWIGTPLDPDALKGVLSPHIVEALRTRQGLVEKVSVPPDVVPAALAGTPRLRRQPGPGHHAARPSPFEVAQAMAERVRVTAFPQLGVLVRWEIGPKTELPSDVLETLRAEAGLDPLGPVEALRKMARQLRSAVAAEPAGAERTMGDAGSVPAQHLLRRLGEIEEALARVSRELDAFVRRWYEQGLPAVQPPASAPSGPVDLRRFRLPPLPELPFLWELTAAAVELTQLWVAWQFAEDTLSGTALRAAGREGGCRRRKWDEADIAAVAAGLRRGMRLKAACAARLRERGDRTSDPEDLARAYRRACREDPRLPRPRAAHSSGLASGRGGRTCPRARTGSRPEAGVGTRLLEPADAGAGRSGPAG